MWPKIGLILHAICAGVLTGVTTHLALTVRAARRGRPSPRLLRLYPTVALVAYGLLVAMGALLYPTYRVEVRAHWLDAHAPWAATLFDIKENFAVLLGPLYLSAWRVTRPPGDRETPSWVLTASAYTIAVGVWINLIAGLVVVSVRSV